MNEPHIVIIHHNPNTLGGMSYFVEVGAPVRVFVVDDRVPHERVYELTLRFSRESLLGIIGDSSIGHAGDERHKAVSSRILAHLEDRPFLTLIDGDSS